MISRDTIALLEFEVNKKNLFVAYVFWFFFGFFGAHRFYLKQKTSAIVMFFIGGLAAALYAHSVFSDPLTNDFEIIFRATFLLINPIIIAIWWVGDMFFIAGIVKKHNNELMARVEQGRRENWDEYKGWKNLLFGWFFND